MPKKKPAAEVPAEIPSRIERGDPGFDQYDVQIHGTPIDHSIITSADVEKREVWCEFEDGRKELKTGSVTIRRRSTEGTENGSS